MWNDPWLRALSVHRAAVVHRELAGELRDCIAGVYADAQSNWYEDENGVLCDFEPSQSRPAEHVWNKRYRPFLQKHAPAFFDELLHTSAPPKEQVATAMRYLPTIAARFEPAKGLLQALSAGTLSSGLVELALPELARLHQAYEQTGEHAEVMRTVGQANLTDSLIPLLLGPKANSRLALREGYQSNGWDVLRVCLGAGHRDVGIGGSSRYVPSQCRGSNFLLGVCMGEEEVATVALGDELLSMADAWATLDLRQVWFEDDALDALVAQGLVDLDSKEREDENDRSVEALASELLADYTERITRFVATARRTAEEGHGLITFVDDYPAIR